MDFLSDDDQDQSEGLRINKKFAQRFEKQKRIDELKRSKSLLDLDEDDEDDSDDESEDDDAELLSHDLELNILNTINSIRKKDPVVYDKQKIWFKRDVSEDENENDEVDQSSSKKKTYKDIVREQLLSNTSVDNDDKFVESENLQHTLTTNKLAYDKEQISLRKKFLESINNENDLDSDEILTEKVKDPDQVRTEILEIEKALEEMQTLGKDSSSNSNVVDEVDQFLADYIGKQKWKDDNGLKLNHIGDESLESNYIDIENDDDDESEVEEADAFESKYNFRFEELEDAEGLKDIQVLGHSRSVSTSLRRVDDKRKIQRQLQKERKEREKRQKEAEIRRLKNLKRQELQERLKKISEIGGLKELGIDETVLDEDWDPAQHDALMQTQFDEDYYRSVDDDKNGVIDESVNDWLLQTEDYNNEFDSAEALEYEALSSTNSKKKKDKKLKRKKASEENDENDVDVEELLHSQRRSDSTETVAAATSMLDELYQLDYEDIVAGIPCRFKYKEVPKEDFGLSIEEILSADDTELNSLVSLKRISAYNKKELSQEDRQKIAKRRKRLRLVLKDRMKIADDNPAVSLIDNVSAPVPIETEDGSGKKKRKRHKTKNIETVTEIANNDSNAIEMQVETKSAAVETADVEKKRKSKNRGGKKSNLNNNKRMMLYR